MLKNDVKMFEYAREHDLGNQIFDMKLSDQDEIRFAEQMLGENAIQKGIGYDNLEIHRKILELDRDDKL